MDISVIGAGAMGMLFGGYLSAKHNVTMIGRNAQKTYNIAKNGITIRETSGEEKTYYPASVSDTSGMNAAELVILFTKSGSSEEALENNKTIIGKNTVLMTLQNGAGHEELLKKYAPEENIIIGTTQQGSYKLDDRSVCHSGIGSTALGVICGRCERFSHIADAFEQCSLPCEVTDNVRQMIWNKLMINASSSVLSGIVQTAQGYVAENEALWSIAKKLIAEICAVACADGYKFDAEEQTERIYKHLKNAPGGYTSIYADIKAGRKTEVRRINGFVADTAKRLGVPAPVNETVTELVIAMEGKNEGRL